MYLGKMDDYFNDRSWMYKRRETDGTINKQFINGVSVFIDFALSNNENDVKIRCPCSRCKLLKHLIPQMVRVHLRQYGFVPNYSVWDRHGEPLASTSTQVEEVVNNEIATTNLVEQMVEDAAHSMFPIQQFNDNDGNDEEEPNMEAKKLYDLLDAAKKPFGKAVKAELNYQ